MLDIGVLILALGVILVGAELFTNGVEWLGFRWGLKEGAVGSVLAAVGTALPETMVPLIAILFGTGKASMDIGIGAILGAPFMLGTLAFFVTGIAALTMKGGLRNQMRVNPEIMARDLRFFLLLYSAAVVTAFIPSQAFRHFIVSFLFAGYVYYVYRTLKSGDECGSEGLDPLFFSRVLFSSRHPSSRLIIFQVICGLGAIISGAHFFVDSVRELSVIYGIAPLILSLIITPIATELPEKFNSVIWIRQGKDTLALGNITGAMVFQSSIIPAIGILLTPWTFTWPAVPLISALFAIGSAGLIYLSILIRQRLTTLNLLTAGLFYVGFICSLFLHI